MAPVPHVGPAAAVGPGCRSRRPECHPPAPQCRCGWTRLGGCPSLHDALQMLDARSGPRDRSPGDPDRHSRVYLDRGYLEVASGRRGGDWTLSGFFARFEIRQRCGAIRLDRLRHGSASTRRRRRWAPTRCRDGPAPDPRPAHPPARDCADLATAPWRGTSVRGQDPRCRADNRARPGLGRRNVHPLDRRASVVTDREVSAPRRLASGRIILAEGNPRITIARRRSLSETMSVVGPLEGSPVAWLDPAITHGVQLGFVESLASESLAAEDNSGRHDAGGTSQVRNGRGSRRPANNR
jgi:hypothetical protein